MIDSPETAPEIWKAVPGFEGKYEVSNMGRVRSLTHARGPRKVPRPNKVWRDKDGYATVSLCVGKSGKTQYLRVNRLVLMAFDRLPVGKEQAAHNNGDNQNDCLSNLRWASRSENEQDKFRHGTAPLGEKCPWSTISDEQARQVKSMIQQGLKPKQILEAVGCSLAIYKNIRFGSSWRHVTLEEESTCAQST